MILYILNGRLIFKELILIENVKQIERIIVIQY